MKGREKVGRGLKPVRDRVVIHGLFFALGHEAFVQPVSLGLLVGTAVLSCLQLTALRTRPLR